MIIYFNEYYIERINYIISHILSSSPGRRLSIELEPGVYDIWKEQSTFPEYIRFAYIKKPKEYKLLPIEEQLDTYYQLNTKGILHILNKSKTQKKLTEWQSNFMLDLFLHFNDYLEENYYIGNDIFYDNLDLCPF